MLKIAEISLPLDGGEEELRRLAAKRLRVPPEHIVKLELVKKSVDARKKADVHFICTVQAELAVPEKKVLDKCRDPKITKAVPYQYQIPVCPPRAQRPVVIGFGPAGMFAGLLLAQAGQRPVILERGAPVEERERDVNAFWNGGRLDPESNVQFGEGGAGTFSDGKLNTGTKDPRAAKVLHELADAGAPAEILYQAKPHIGTDKLPQTVKNIREKIRALGGEIHFHTRLDQLLIRDGAVYGVRAQGPQGSTEWETDCVVLAIGHSARDTFRMIHDLGVHMEPKPFSVGVRIEHLQSCIDASQYGKFAGHPALGAADYRLAEHLPNGRGVYTFCMCPGGSVVAAASEEGMVVTNGMSRFARDGRNANSALLVGIGPEDFGSDHPLAGVSFQRDLERRAFALGGGTYRAPAQRAGDFLAGIVSTRLGEVSPTYLPGVELCDLADCLPDFVTESLREGIVRMDRKLPGFAHPDALLTGTETRSSSPVRIVRGEDLQSVTVRGLYPCGEGAGYAGGIVSAAVDGVRCAERILAGHKRGITT